LITDAGKLHIKRVLAGWEPAVGRSIAFGIGDVAEASTDSRLQFEVERIDVALSSYDFINDSLVFKARVPDRMAGQITEVGLYTGRVNSVGWQTGSRLISTFDSSSEQWLSGGSAATYSTTGSRTGVNSLALNAAANGSSTATLDGIFFDLSGGSLLDDFSFAFYSTDTNTSSVSVKFKNDADNYFQFNLTPIVTGYQVVKVSRSTAVITGSPRWEEILSIDVTLNAKAAGAASITMDALRVDSQGDVGGNNFLVAREVLAIPFVKENDRSQEVEFRLAVSI
jgi:hypothetical protein